MIGINMLIKHGGLEVRLRPLAKNDIKVLAANFSSMRVHLYTMGTFAQPLENEEEWYEVKRKSDGDCVWAIQPAESDEPIGVTALHEIVSRENSCSSGIIIWDTKWWGKGIASATHLGRTLFAADYLNRSTIKSCVRVENNASRKALERVGYSIWGTEPIDDWREGRWLDTHHLKWFHPERINFLFPNGIPEKFKAGVSRAKIALDLARSEVVFP